MFRISELETALKSEHIIIRASNIDNLFYAAKNGRSIQIVVRGQKALVGTYDGKTLESVEKIIEFFG